jgi:hypothetical protein
LGDNKEMLWSEYKNTAVPKDDDSFLLWLEDPRTSAEDLLEQLNLPNTHSDSTNQTEKK